MSLTIAHLETHTSRLDFVNASELFVSSPKVFHKQDIEKITSTEKYFCNVSFSDFTNVFRFEVVHIEGNVLSNQIALSLQFSNKFILKLTLNGYWELLDEPVFQLNAVDWFFEEIDYTPTSAFLLESFKAMICLSKKIKVEIPLIDYYFENTFNIPLNRITENLQNRQLAYRLMVIENACKISLPFPRRYIKGEEVENIAFCYHLIVEREFDWFSIPTIIQLIANEDSLSWLPKTNKPTLIRFQPNFLSKHIFEFEIRLGMLTAEIEKAVIDNYAEVKKKLSKLDNSIVEVKLRSLSGVTRIIAVDVPTISPKSWSPQLRHLIDLETKLDSMVLDNYFAVAALPFEGLTKKKKKSILERPNLDEDAFDF